ncbi:MAG: cobalamin-binding protein [Thermoanaerobaculia bacterium]|nr:cobalamin-binding protein [Thermoanaerobaculia bacterium]
MRIVSLLPSATEIVCDLGLDSQLCGISHECDYPESVAGLPVLTSSAIDPKAMTPAEIDEAVSRAVSQGEPLYGVDTDLLNEIEPQLIVTQGLCDVCAVSGETVAKSLDLDMEPALRETKVVTLAATTVDGILRDLQRVGAAAGIPAATSQRAGYWRARWEALRRRPRPGTTLRVIVLEWTDPAFLGGHWVPEMVEAAGGVHLLNPAGSRSKRCAWERIVSADPDILIVAACGYGLAENIEFALRLRREHPELRAIADGQLWACDANSYFARPAPRVIEGAELLAQIVRGIDPPKGRAQRIRNEDFTRSP